jgi:hypothetical protein
MPSEVALTLRASFFRRPVARKVLNSSLSSVFGIADAPFRFRIEAIPSEMQL